MPLNNSYSVIKLLSPTELQLLLFEANCRKILLQDKGLTRKLNQCSQIKTNCLKESSWILSFFNPNIFGTSQVITMSWISWGFYSELLPLIRIENDRRIRKDSVHLMMEIIFSQLSPVLLAVFWAICLWNSLPKHSETKSTNTVRMPHSMLITRLYCWSFFSHSHVSLEFLVFATQTFFQFKGFDWSLTLAW